MLGENLSFYLKIKGFFQPCKGGEGEEDGESKE